MTRRRSHSGLYVMLWGILAAMAVGYMAVLLLQPEWAGPLTAQALQRDTPSPQARLTLQLQAEVDSLRRTVADLQRELAYVKTASLRNESESTEGARAASATESGQAAPVPAAAPAAPVVAAAPPAERAERESAPPSAAPAATAAEPARGKQKPVVLNAKSNEPAKPPEPAKPAEVAKAGPPKIAELETGSLPPIPQEPRISFGPPTVKTTPEPVAIVLESGPSIEALRLRWNVLHERHASMLRDLEPRYLTSGSREAPSYQLVAGPITSPDEAKRICALLRAKKVPCSVGSAFIGNAL